MQDLPPSLQSLGTQISAASSVAVFSHMKPDGDAYGSALGLGLTLRHLGVKVTIYNQDGLLDMYRFLPGSALIEKTPSLAPLHDLIVSLDTSTEERLGSNFLAWEKKVDINLDHHVSNTLYGKINHINPDVPATASLVIDLIQTCQWPLHADAASCLFVGLSTDTGSFRYRGTTAATFRQAADLSTAGADTAELSRLCYQSMSPQRFALLRLAYESLKTECNHTLAYYTLTPEMFTQTGAKPEDTEGIVETSLSVNSIEAGALFEIKSDGSLKVSLRSKGKINMSQIASSFGGGGHPGAAGINFPSGAAGHKESVLAEIRAALKKLPS